MKFFDELGKDVLARWHRVGFDDCAFARVACDALAARPPSVHVDPSEVTRWVLAADTLPTQPGLDAKFGEPAVTVFYDERFYIEVLFWLDGTTTIHQHAFAGAFHVLAGASIESVYRFTEQRRHSTRLLVGDVERTSSDQLGRGAIRPILAGRSFIHALFHLERPSVSVVVRTRHDPESGPQYAYSRAGFAIDPFYKPDIIRSRVATLKLLQKTEEPSRFAAIFGDMLQRADATLAVYLLTELLPRFARHEEFRDLLTLLPLPHEELASTLARYAEHERRAAAIVKIRSRVTDPEHRFFLAALLNLDDRASIVELVRKAFPQRQPVETIVTWLRALARLDAIHDWVGSESKLGTVARLDVSIGLEEAQTARRMLNGEPLSGPIAERLRGSAVLGALFA